MLTQNLNFKGLTYLPTSLFQKKKNICNILKLQFWIKLENHLYELETLITSNYYINYIKKLLH